MSTTDAKGRKGRFPGGGGGERTMSDSEYMASVDETAQLYALLGYYRQMNHFQRMTLIKFARGCAKPSLLRFQSVDEVRRNADFEQEDRWRNPDLVLLDFDQEA